MGDNPPTRGNPKMPWGARRHYQDMGSQLRIALLGILFENAIASFGPKMVVSQILVWTSLSIIDMSPGLHPTWETRVCFL